MYKKDGVMVFRKKHGLGTYLAIGLLVLSSCVVSKEKYQAKKAELKEVKKRNDSLEGVNRELNKETRRLEKLRKTNQEKTQRIEKLNRRLDTLNREYEELGRAIKQVRKENRYLKHKNEVVKYRLNKVRRIVDKPIDTPQVQNGP